MLHPSDTFSLIYFAVNTLIKLAKCGPTGSYMEPTIFNRLLYFDVLLSVEFLGHQSANRPINTNNSDILSTLITVIRSKFSLRRASPRLWASYTQARRHTAHTSPLELGKLGLQTSWSRNTASRRFRHTCFSSTLSVHASRHQTLAKFWKKKLHSFHPTLVRAL